MMKKILLAFFVSVWLLPATLSAGEIVRLTRYMGESLTGVSASFLFQVELISSEQTKAVAEVPLELEPYLKFNRRSDGVVVVDMNIPREVSRRLEREYNDYWKNNKLTLKLYTPTVQSISLTTVAKLTATGRFRGDVVKVSADAATQLDGLNISANRLEVKLSGAAKAWITAESSETQLNIDGAGRLDLRLSGNNSIRMKIEGAGNVTLVGNTRNAVADISGAGKLHATEFPAERLEVTASAAANARVHATRYLKISTSTAAKVQYTGKPAELYISNPNVTEIK